MIKKGNRLYKHWDNTTMGTLEIAGDRLDVHVNSERARKRYERQGLLVEEQALEEAEAV